MVESNDVMRTIIIESECIVENLDFPKHLDHAWLFIAAGIHRRLSEKLSDGSYLPGIVSMVESNTPRTYVLTIDCRYMWSDGTNIKALEVASALRRGEKAGLFESVRVVRADKLEVRMAGDVRPDHAFLASPLFTLTPSCRSDAKGIATCGPYEIIFCSPDKRMMAFGRRGDPLGCHGPAKVSIVVTQSRSQGLRLLQGGQLAITCPLGADPDEFRRFARVNTVTNRLTNLGIVLRPYTECPLSRDKWAVSAISHSIDRNALAHVTGGTFIPMTTVSNLFSPRHSSSAFSDNTAPNDDKAFSSFREVNDKSKILEIQYARYKPNKRVAEEIAKQLYRNLGIQCTLVPVPYADYVASIYPDHNGMSLEVLQPFMPQNVCRAMWYFADTTEGETVINPWSNNDIAAQRFRPVAIPLLQALTSLISLDERYRGKSLLDNEALIDWSRL